MNFPPIKHHKTVENVAAALDGVGPRTAVELKDALRRASPNVFRLGALERNGLAKEILELLLVFTQRIGRPNLV